MPKEAEADRLAVLVVDDDRAMSRLLKQNLEGGNTEVIEAASGFECIRALQQFHVDLVLLDVRLPDFSGWGVLSLLRLTDRLRDMPVIVFSEDPPNNALMERLRPDDYIQKPFDMRDLLARVSRVASSRSARGRPHRAG